MYKTHFTSKEVTNLHSMIPFEVYMHCLINDLRQKVWYLKTKQIKIYVINMFVSKKISFTFSSHILIY